MTTMFLVGLVAVPALYLILKLSGWFAGTPCTVKTRMDGKTVVITGGNTGIGKETALEMARRGAKVLIGCRDIKKAEKAVIEIKKETGVQVTVVPLDLADTGSVEEFCARINKEKKVDVLVNNAGLMMPKYTGTKQGFELHMGVNHLGHHLLTHRLYNLLARTGTKKSPSRVINVSSAGHKFSLNFSGLDLEDPEFGKESWAHKFKTFAFHQLYGHSKLAQIYHARELKRIADRRGDHVTSVSLHPGAVSTEVTRYHEIGFSRSIVAFIDNMIALCGKTAAEGAWTTVYCCVEDANNLKGGAYYVDCAEETVVSRWPGSKDDPAKEKKLYEISDKLLNIKQSLEVLH